MLFGHYRKAMKKSEFFNSAQTWSKRKHRLLGKYLVPFSAKVGRLSSDIFCIDGFAGQGRYADGTDGSPLLMAHVADECETWANPIRLLLINVEANRQNYKKLCEATEPWVTRGVVNNEHGRFGDLVPKILSTIGDKPAFFFIDPFGPSPIHFEFLRPILSRRQPITELIINFDLDGLRRLADGLRANTHLETSRKACETIVQNVTKILGRDRWRQFFETDRLSAPDRSKALLDDYIDSLSGYGYHVVAYPIRDSVASSPKYYLIYCTRHPDGIGLMSRFIRSEEDQLLRESFESDQMFLLDPLEEEIAARRVELRNIILNYLQHRPKLTRGEIKRHFIFERFGDFSEPDYNAVVQQMIETGILSPATGRSRINDTVLLTYIPIAEGVLT
jgi:three-Cys-motif partner protein